MRTMLQSSSTLVMLGIVASAILFGPSSARADDKQTCMAAYISAQRLKQDDKLVAARAQLLICGREVCPTTLKRDCSVWLSDVDQSMPTVVIEARGPDGSDVVDVRVKVDGQPFIDRIEGKEKAVDPGVHTFRYEIEGAQPIEARVVIRAGEKMRKLSVRFMGGKSETTQAAPQPSTTAAASTTAPGPSASSYSDQPSDRPIPALVYVFGAVTLAAAGTFTYLALKFDSQVSDLDQCKGSCQQSKVDDAASTRTLSYIPLGVGVVSLGVTAVLYLSRPAVPVSESTGSKETARPRWDFVSVPGGAMATVGTRF
jgi:hypothetical protein